MQNQVLCNFIILDTFIVNIPVSYKLPVYKFFTSLFLHTFEVYTRKKNQLQVKVSAQYMYFTST